MTFDRTKAIALSFVKGGVETVVKVNYPSDELLIRRAKKLPQQMRSLHGGRTEAVNRDPDKEMDEDLALFEAIRISPDDVDEQLALKTVEILDMGHTRAVRGTGGLFEIELEILQGAVVVQEGGSGEEGLMTVHRLREPTIRQQRRFASQSSTLRTLPGGQFQLVENLAASGYLYDDLFDSVDGYEPGKPEAVPVTHKAAVISRLLSELSGATAAELSTGE